jgi:hypothetical protein
MRSSCCSSHSQSAVITVTRLADEAWWPPTLTESSDGRSRFAWSTMRMASHSTRFSMRRSTSSEIGPEAAAGSVVAVFIAIVSLLND